jgi:hypothetical protein
MLRVKKHASTPCTSDVFSLGLTFESLKELGVRQQKFIIIVSDGDLGPKDRILLILLVLFKKR